MFNDIENVNKDLLKLALIIVICLIVMIGGWMYIGPQYRIWQQDKEGQAELARAEQNRQIQVTAARAKNEAATMEAEAKITIAKAEAAAELIRAQGVAQATKIIDGNLSERYIRYRWVEGLNDGSGEVIYVPTEANLPLLEARNK